MNILRTGLDRSGMSNNLSHSILNTSAQVKGGIQTITAGIASHGSIQNGNNSTIMAKLRKTPSDFPLASYLHRESNLMG